MAPEEIETWKQLGAVVAAIVVASVGAWRSGWRKAVKSTEYTEDKAGQPRVITRGEWHTITNFINRHEGRIIKLEGRATAIEATFERHMLTAAATMESFHRLEGEFRSHVDRWEEVGTRAAQDRVELREDVRALNAKLDRLIEREQRR